MRERCGGRWRRRRQPATAVRLEERLQARAALVAAVAAEEAAVGEAGAEAAALLAEGKALSFDAATHAAANAARAGAAQAVERARAGLTDVRLDERGLSERLSERRARLDADVARRAELAGREAEARHLGRLAELLAEFRNSLVGQVGPALSAQTTALFRELTDGRFDSLEVDGDTFELRVGSAGHPLDRHSGSETDLANLSLRVAIGEQVRFQSGGAVGLLVLDEVLGALDGEHRDRLLGALTRLGARFRQVLVVTHAGRREGAAALRHRGGDAGRRTLARRLRDRWNPPGRGRLTTGRESSAPSSSHRHQSDREASSDLKKIFIRPDQQVRAKGQVRPRRSPCSGLDTTTPHRALLAPSRYLLRQGRGLPRARWLLGRGEGSGWSSGDPVENAGITHPRWSGSG